MCNRKWAVYVGYKILPRLPSEPIDSRVPPTSTVLIVNFQLSLLLVAVGQKEPGNFDPLAVLSNQLGSWLKNGFLEAE